MSWLSFFKSSKPRKIMFTENVTPEQLTLFFSPYCPYCHRVLNALFDMDIAVDLAANNAGGITLKDTFSNREAKVELQAGGGKAVVPCLLIEHEGKQHWQYESLDIIAFLQQHLD